jgi:hypothetical protein
MIDRRTAKELVEQYINENFHGKNDRLVVLEDYTIERPYGWVFFYSSEMWLKTKDPNYLLLGNFPILVECESGRLVQLAPTHVAGEIEEQLREYEMKNGL